MYIHRHIEKIIKKSINQFYSLIITGPRQVGKSTVLQFCSQNTTNITFDDPTIRSYAKNEPSLFMKSNPTPLLLDEVQYVPELFPYIKMEIDKKHEKGMFLMTGSQAFQLMKNASESLAGRVCILELQGLSLREINQVNFNEPFIPNEHYLNERKKEIVKYDNIWERIHRGGMPELTDSEISWDLYYSSYVKTYIERDIRQLIQVSDETMFFNFMVALAARSGEMLNYSAIASDLGISVDTIKRWTSILKTSGIIYIMEPYYNNVIKRVVKTPKIYFLDTGLVCYLTKWTTSDALRNGAKAGNIFETFIVSEIIKSYMNAGITQLPIYYYRDKDKKEIDLIIEQDGILYPIEIKMTASPTKTMAKSFSVLDNIPDKIRGNGIILCQSDYLMYFDENLIVLPIEYI